MSTGGSKTQTTKSENAPWAGAQPYMTQALSAASAEFNKGAPKYYPGQTVAGMNSMQRQGLSGIQQNAGMAGQMANRGVGAIAPLQDGSMFSQFTSGQPNPYLGDLYKQGSRQIADDVNAQFSKAGRYGSGAQTNVLSRNMGDMWTNLASGAYENDRNRALSATQSDANARLSANSQLPGLYGLSQQGNNDLLGAGGYQQAQDQSMIDADVARYNYDQNAQRNNIEWLNAIASGNGSLGGTSTGTGTNPNRRSATENLIGLGSTLGSAWLLSDRRLKTNIKPLGQDEFGVKWYSYRYHWDQPGRVRVGVMADEVPAHAVRMTPAGFKAVEYGAL